MKQRKSFSLKRSTLQPRVLGAILQKAGIEDSKEMRASLRSGLAGVRTKFVLTMELAGVNDDERCKQLASIEHHARALVRLLGDSPLRGTTELRRQLRSLRNASNAERDRIGKLDGHNRHKPELKDPFQMLASEWLPTIFFKLTGKKPTINRIEQAGGRPAGHYIEFALASLDAIGVVRSNGAKYSPEALAKYRPRTWK